MSDRDPLDLDALRESGALASARTVDDQTAQAIVDDLGLALATRSGDWRGSSVSLVREISRYLSAIEGSDRARIDAVRALMDDWATDDSAAGWMKDRLYAALEGDA